MTKTILLSIGVLLLLTLGPTDASAAPITFHFEGTITDISADLAAPPFVVGDSFSADITFESSAPDQHLLDNVGLYSITELSFSLGGYSAAAPDGRIRVDHPFDGNGNLENAVRWIVGSSSTEGLAGNPVSGFPPQSFSITLRDEDGTGVTVDLLPTALNLGDFELRSGSALFCNDWVGDAMGGTCFGGGFVRFEVESFAVVQAVPEPASLLLLSSGLAGLVAHRRREKNK